MKKVYIVGPSYFSYFNSMFKGRGWQVVDSIAEADVVQFTGGEDINPELYGERVHHRTYFSDKRDAHEIKAYEEAQSLGKFCAGVCRGGQLLNVLSGGSMYQDVRGHAGGFDGHDVVDVESGAVFNVTSIHHQMMKLGSEGVLLAKSTKMLSKTKLGMTKLGTKEAVEVVTVDDNVEVEACYYPSTKSFCYQPHPEFANDGSDCRNYYFDKLEELLS